MPSDHIQEAVEATAKTLVALDARREILKIAEPFFAKYYEDKGRSEERATLRAVAEKWASLQFATEEARYFGERYSRKLLTALDSDQADTEEGTDG
jgi:predicted metal-dependent hydrolase